MIRFSFRSGKELLRALGRDQPAGAGKRNSSLITSWQVDGVQLVQTSVDKDSVIQAV
jgi:hypothetical protein